MFILIHFLVRHFQQIHNQIIMIFAADIISHSIADGMDGCLIVGIKQGLQLHIHLLQLRPGSFSLDNHKFIAAESCQKTVFCENSGEIGSKCLNKQIAFFMSVGVVDFFQIVQIEHHDADVQCIIGILKFQQFFFQ